MNALVAGLDLLDGIGPGEACYLEFAVDVAVAVGVGVLVVIARAEARSRIGEAERVAELRRLLTQSARSRVPVEGPPS